METASIKKSDVSKNTVFRTVPFALKDASESSDSSGSFGYFKGYAAVFGNVDRTMDVIAPGAFAASLKNNSRIKLCWQHDMRMPIGSFTEMKEDDHGLYCEGRINLGTEKGKEAYALIKAGDLDGLSIGYSVKTYEYDRDSAVRTLKELTLWEVSIVTVPANTRAKVTSVKSALAEAGSLADIEDILTEKGFSKKQARTVISRVKEFTPKRDVSEDAPRDAGGEGNVKDAVKMLAQGILDINKQFKQLMESSNA